jgi:lipid A 3-O-deacylase
MMKGFWHISLLRASLLLFLIFPLKPANSLAGADDSRFASGVTNSPVNANGFGTGFSRGTWETGFTIGGGFGVKAITGTLAHDLVLGSVHAGYFLSDPLGEDKWYRGNWEFLLEAFGGEQLHPNSAYVAGIAPLFRYNFATRTRFIPFITLGAGVSATDIGHPDLNGTFQFNVQAGAGTHYFLTRATALTFEYRWLHLSNAGTSFPNLGTNTQMFFGGLSWFF